MDRFILGTAAVTDPEFLENAIHHAGAERVIVGVDARNGIVKISGWEEDTDLHYDVLMERLVSQGVENIIFTDISQDGMLTGPNFDSYIQILKKYPFNLIASGGISSVKDIVKFGSIRDGKGIFGVITGKAIYEGRLDLEDAINQIK